MDQRRCKLKVITRLDECKSDKVIDNRRYQQGIIRADIEADRNDYLLVMATDDEGRTISFKASKLMVR